MTKNHSKRLEELRMELRAERISYGELTELQSLKDYIQPGDVELLEAAGVPEFQIELKPAYVILKADPNPDYDYPDPRASVQTVKIRVPVRSFRSASKACVNFINGFDLGSGNWTGGQIGDIDGNIIAHVSYNGRVWEGEHWTKDSREIVI